MYTDNSQESYCVDNLLVLDAKTKRKVQHWVDRHIPWLQVLTKICHNFNSIHDTNPWNGCKNSREVSVLYWEMHGCNCTMWNITIDV